MKKIVGVVCLLAVMLTAFAACGKNGYEIEDYEWKLRTALRTENSGTVVAVGEEAAAYPDAEVVDVVLKADDGEIAIIDKTNNETHNGAYEDMYVTEVTNDYKVIFKGTEGYVNVSETEYADNSRVPTLVMALGDYDLYFYADIAE